MTDDDGGFNAVDVRNDSKSRRGRPWDSLLRKFFRKGRQSDPQQLPEPVRTSTGTGSALFCIRSRSASDLSSIDIPVERPNRSPVVGDAYANGIAVSHDSVFAGEPLEDDEEDAITIAPKQILLSSVQDELRATLLRRQTKINAAMTESEEDLGLPKSPASVSPPSRDPLSFPRQGGQSALGLRNRKGSDGSMLSMDYTEQDEDISANVATSSALKHSTSVIMDDGIPQPEPDGETTASFPLNHAAARHKMAVRPKRAHVTSRARNLQHLSSVEEAPPSGDEVQEVIRRARPQGLPPARGSVKRVDSRRSSSQVRAPTQAPDISPKLRSVSLTRSNERSPSPPPSPLSRLTRSRSSAERKIQHEVDAFQRRNSGANAATSDEKKSEVTASESQNIFSRLFPRRRSSRKNSADLPPVHKPGDSQEPRNPPALPPKERDVSRKNSFVADSKPEPKNWRSSEVEPENPSPVEQETLNFASFFDRIREGSRSVTKPVPIPRKTLIKETSPNVEDKGYESLDITPDFLKPRKHSREETQESASVRPWVKVLPIVNVNDLRRGNDDNETSVKYKKQTSYESRSDNPSRPARRVHSFRGASTAPLPLDTLIDLTNRNEEAAKGSESEKSLESLTEVDLNADFILKKPVESNPAAPVIRRSLETLKFSNEGLKKTINSLNRHSQSSDQLMLSDDSVNKNSNDSLSTGSSSLNISDTEGLGSSYSLSRESLDKIDKPSVVVKSYADTNWNSNYGARSSDEAFSSMEYSLSPKKDDEAESFFETPSKLEHPTTPVVLRSFAEPFSPPEIKSRIVSETAQLFGKFSEKFEKTTVTKTVEPVKNENTDYEFPEVILRPKPQVFESKLEVNDNTPTFDLDLKSSVFGMLLKNKFSEMRNSVFRPDDTSAQPHSLDSSLGTERVSTFEIPILRKISKPENDLRSSAPVVKKEDTRPVKPERTSLMKRAEMQEEPRIKQLDNDFVEAKRPATTESTEASELLRVFARRSLKLRDAESTVTESKTDDNAEKVEKKKETDKSVIEVPKLAPVMPEKQESDSQPSAWIRGKSFQAKTDKPKSDKPKEPEAIKPQEITKKDTDIKPPEHSKRAAFQAAKQVSIEAPPVRSPIKLEPSPVLTRKTLSPVLSRKVELGTASRTESDSKRIESKLKDEPISVKSKEVLLIPKEKSSPRAVRLRSKTLPEVNYPDALAVKSEPLESVEPQSITSVPSYGVTLRPTGNLIVNRTLRVESGLDEENNIWKRISAQPKITNVAKIAEEAEVAKRFASRQSKVLDLVNNFQRLQVT